MKKNSVKAFFRKYMEEMKSALEEYGKSLSL